MRIMRYSILLGSLFCSAIMGCAGATGAQRGMASRIKTITSVGDQTLPVVAGAPGATVASDRDSPERRSDREGRISGRVLDEGGRPVPNADVRVAVDGAAKGKAIVTTTDESGAFTLRGLRRGVRYSVIAEHEVGQELLSGRSETKAPDSDVEISLRVDDLPPPASAPGRIDRVSERMKSTEQDEVPGSSPSDPDEAAPPPIEENQAPSLPSSRPDSKRDASAAGWSSEDSSNESSLKQTDPDPETSEPAPAKPRRRAANRLDEDEGPDPLPPAREKAARPRPSPKELKKADEVSQVPDKVADEPKDAGQPPRPESSAVSSGAQPPDLDQLAPAPTLPDLKKTEAKSEPTKSVTAEEGAQAPSLEPEKSAPADSAPMVNADLPEKSAGQGGAGSKVDEPKLPALEESSPPSAAAEPPADQPTTKSEATEPPAKEAPSTADDAPKLSTAEPVEERADREPRRLWKWGELAKQASTPSTIVASNTRPRDSKQNQAFKAFCEYDRDQHRLIDFRLPDLHGKPVSLRDLGADLVLIDFWGSWCAPCIESIPHLMALQQEYGPKRLKVVGIAYEEGTTPQKFAAADGAARRLSVDYPILMGGIDGPCPLQAALHVQVYPTMILVDRSGRILWREQGATPRTLARLDSVLAAHDKSSIARR